MSKIIKMVLIVSLLIVFNSSVLKAGIVDELNYVSDKSDFYSYINFSRIMNYISIKGIDINDLDSLVMNSANDETSKIINSFGIKFSDINEFLMVINSRDIEKKSGYLVFISFKEGKGIIPESFKKTSIKLKSGTAYKASADEDIVFTKVNDFFVIGSSEYLGSFLENRLLNKSVLSARSSQFIKKVSDKSIFFHLTVSDYLKDLINSAMNSSMSMARGLKENVFIQTLLSLESIDWGVEINDKITFRSGLQGSKIEDSERLQMLSHTLIVGSSFIVSFADMMAARSGSEKLNELTSDQQLMSWLQKVFGRIHVRQEDKGVIISFEMTPAETDILVSFIKKEMDKEKKVRAERVEREKISKLTLAIKNNNIESVQNYIKNRYNLNGLDTDGNTPLGAAAVNGNVKIARLLIEKGAGINLQNIDKLTALHQAVKSEQKDMVAFLLSKGADVNAKSDTDLTALHYNAMQGNSEITRILIAKGANVNAADTDASTPLHFAASSGFIKVVKVLVEKKADPSLMNKNEQRAIESAAQNNQTEVVEYLKVKFKQEPKSSSIQDNSFNQDFNMNDDTAPYDDGTGDSMFRNEDNN